MATSLDPTVNCDTIGFTGTNAGGMLKETGTVHWKSPNTGAINSTGFSSLGTGNRSTNGGYGLLRTTNPLWTSSSGENGFSAFIIGIFYNSSMFYFDPQVNSVVKLEGPSIRCIKTEE